MVHVKNCPEKKKKNSQGKTKKTDPEHIFEKIASDNSKTRFKWIKVERMSLAEMFS